MQSTLYRDASRVDVRDQVLRVSDSRYLQSRARSLSDDAGSATLLLIAVLLIASVLVWLALWLGVVVNMTVHVRGAADLVAIAAADAQRVGGLPCVKAHKTAADNQVELVDCAAVGDSFDFVVSVTVAGELPIPGELGVVKATAHAGWLSN